MVAVVVILCIVGYVCQQNVPCHAMLLGIMNCCWRAIVFSCYIENAVDEAQLVQGMTRVEQNEIVREDKK